MDLVFRQFSYKFGLPDYNVCTSYAEIPKAKCEILFTVSMRDFLLHSTLQYQRSRSVFQLEVNDLFAGNTDYHGETRIFVE